MIPPRPADRPPRVCAVGFLNTVPLVWGMLHGGQRGQFQLDFRTPAECADALASGAADVGIVPVVEVVRQGLRIVPGTGIACCGAVRSILLISRVPPAEIRTLATDSSSRTSVLLARVILADGFGVTPAVVSMPPDLGRMLAEADAALIIGDEALRLDPAALPYKVWDLGREWFRLTGLPMVFALWAGPADRIDESMAAAFADSCRFGLAHLDDIVRAEAKSRGMSAALVREYFAENVTFQIGPWEQAGLREFLRRAARFDNVLVAGMNFAC